jgi:HlyD family secretion protein
MKAFFSFLFSVRTIVLLLVLAGLGAGGWYIYTEETANAAGPGYRTDMVVRRNLTATIAATGTIEPEEVVDVGAQVNGQILKFGADPTDPTGQRVVDYCTPVEQGTVLAQIDPTIYQARLDQAQAALLAAKKGLASAEFNIAKSTANRNALSDAYQRDARSPSAIAQGQVVTDKGAYEAAVADTKAQEAAKEQAEFNVKLAEGNLKEAKTNVDYCTIKASVKGVIVDRRVNVGQTVVSGLSAPSLFLLAKDLMRMQVWASVNEADIGHIHKGADVTFTVDARPGQVFQGTVQEIRYNATMTQNVVTYTVVVSTQNRLLSTPVATKVKTPSGKVMEAPSTGQGELELLPYLTANLTFHVAERTDALQVPNAALRWRPQLDHVAPEFRDDYEQSLRKKAAKEESADQPAAAAPDKKDGGKKQGGNGGGAANHGIVWVQDGAFVRPIKLQTGLTDGAMTEVVRVHQDDNLHKDDALDVGMALVTGENAAHAAAATTNPFQMKLFAPKKKPDQQ